MFAVLAFLAALAASLEPSIHATALKTGHEAPMSQEEVDIMFPYFDDKSIEMRKSGYKDAREYERKTTTALAAACVDHCRDEAPPGQRGACGRDCLEHEQRGTGVPYAYNKPTTVGLHFDSDMALPAFLLLTALKCMHYAANLHYLTYNRVFWAVLGMSLTIAALGILLHMYLQ